LDVHDAETIGTLPAGGVADGSTATRGAAIDRALTFAIFARGAVAYWLSVFPQVCLLVVRWRGQARRIPDPLLRSLALAALEKRGNIEGAAAFAAFAPWRRRAAAVRAAGAFQCAYNLLDMLGEQPSADPVRDGRRLHEALVFALTPGAPRLDWYELHPQREDGGFLDSLLDECRTAFVQLPAAQTVQPWARDAAERIADFQSLNLSEAQGDHAGLAQWGERATPAGTDLRWWETAAAAGSSLAVHALIAAAAEPGLNAEQARSLSDAYFPWIGCLHSLLDNLIDKREDEAAGHRSLLEYYPPADAAARLGELTLRARAAAANIPNSLRHRVMLTAMIANYLSSPEAHSPELSVPRDAVIASADAMIGAAMAVFAVRRIGE
jgi:tetraprenyl-beta-curcumene synthase